MNSFLHIRGKGGENKQGRLVGVGLVGVGVGLLVVVDVLGHLPDLHDVVLAHRADDPGLVGVPGEVGDLGRVAAVDEEELGGAVLHVVGRLLLADLGEIPDVEAAVGAARRQDGLVVRRPLHLEDLVLVRLERVELHLRVAQVPQSHRLF